MPDDKKGKKYWYDKYAPKKHSKGYWRGRYNNTILRDPEYYLEHYGKDGKKPQPKPETKRQKPERADFWNNLDEPGKIIIMILIIMYVCSKLSEYF